MRKLKRDDSVVVIAGRDKGKRGDIVRFVTEQRVLVSGVNLVKKHTKPNPNMNEPGGIISKEAPIHVSNLAIYNDDTEKADRVGIRVEDGKKVRFFKSNDKPIDE